MYFSYLIVHARHVHVLVLRTKAFDQEPQVLKYPMGHSEWRDRFRIDIL